MSRIANTRSKTPPFIVRVRIEPQIAHADTLSSKVLLFLGRSLPDLAAAFHQVPDMLAAADTDSHWIYRPFVVANTAAGR